MKRKSGELNPQTTTIHAEILLQIKTTGMQKKMQKSLASILGGKKNVKKNDS